MIMSKKIAVQMLIVGAIASATTSATAVVFVNATTRVTTSDPTSITTSANTSDSTATATTSAADQPSGHLASSWLATAALKAHAEIAKNISPVNSEALPGAIIAARTRRDPNYYYHWVRDAGIVIEAFLKATQDSDLNKIYEYVDFSERIQTLPPNGHATTGLGEPKFEVNGTQFIEEWGRPQNDGPALRVISLIPFVQILKERNRPDYITSRLYNSQLPATTILKRDLEFISHHWRDPSVDLWEEVKGDHFYTRMVQLRALIEGAQLARSQGDAGAANWYDQQAREIQQTLDGFWDGARGYFVATQNRVGGLDYKNSELDVAVILGLLHGDSANNFISFQDSRVLSTIHRLIKVFAEQYPINQVAGAPGIAIGRYPEDRYAGPNFSGGNPWPLATLALAEASYKVSAEFRAVGEVSSANHWLDIGDQQVLRVKLHAHSDGSLNEQIDRFTGYMTSVSDLTWNYAAVLTTARARERATRPR